MASESVLPLHSPGDSAPTGVFLAGCGNSPPAACSTPVNREAYLASMSQPILHRETNDGRGDGLFAQPAGYCPTDTAPEWIVAYGATIECFRSLLARIIHECRREAFETESSRGFSQARPNGNSHAGREDRTTEQAFMNSPGQRLSLMSCSRQTGRRSGIYTRVREQSLWP
jgi:hypothetical protein